MNNLTWKSWNILCLSLICSGILAICVLSEWLLFRLNENTSLNKTIDIQNKEDVLYGSLLNNQSYIYKLRMVTLKQPEILVVGSSRVMCFRKEFFDQAYSFYNVGGAVPTIEKGIEFINKMPANFKPKIIILGIDLWWLNSNYHDRRDLQPILEETNIVNQRVKLYGALFENITNGNLSKLGITFSDMPNLNITRDPIEGRKTIGILAALRGDGFRGDGSWQYGSVITGTLKKDYSSEVKAIHEGRGVFAYGSNISQHRLVQLESFIRLLKSKSEKLIVFAPPYAHEIYSLLLTSAHHNGFMNTSKSALVKLCRDESVQFHDFSDITWYGSNDNETHDGYHGNEKSYARISYALSSDNTVKHFFNQGRLLQYIK